MSAKFPEGGQGHFLPAVYSFCSWAGWFDSYLVEKPRRHIFAWCGSFSTFLSDIIMFQLHTRLTMYYIRPFQYDCTSRWLYVLVLVALRSVLVTSREYTCIFTFYTLLWRRTVCKFQKRKIWGKAFYSFYPYGTICFVTADRKLD